MDPKYMKQQEIKEAYGVVTHADHIAEIEKEYPRVVGELEYLLTMQNSDRDPMEVALDVLVLLKKEQVLK